MTCTAIVRHAAPYATVALHGALWGIPFGIVLGTLLFLGLVAFSKWLERHELNKYRELRETVNTALDRIFKESGGVPPEIQKERDRVLMDMFRFLT